MLQEISYRDKLTALNLESLEHRRLRLDLCLLYKIIFGTCDVDLNDILSLRLTVSSDFVESYFLPVIS